MAVHGLSITEGCVELALFLERDPAFVPARVAAYPAGALRKVVVPAENTLPLRLRIAVPPEDLRTERAMDHTQPVVPAKRTLC